VKGSETLPVGGFGGGDAVGAGEGTEEKGVLSDVVAKAGFGEAAVGDAPDEGMIQAGLGEILMGIPKLSRYH